MESAYLSLARTLIAVTLVSVTILDDSAVMTPNGFNGVATGSGVVQSR